jgi:hypothetical protein
LRISSGWTCSPAGALQYVLQIWSEAPHSGRTSEQEMKDVYRRVPQSEAQ